MKYLPIVLFISAVILAGSDYIAYFNRSDHFIVDTYRPDIAKRSGQVSQSSGQIVGGPNSIFNNPNQLFGSDRIITPMQVAQFVISLVFMGASLFVVLSKKYAAAEKHWAYGALGTILGFWLRGS